MSSDVEWEEMRKVKEKFKQHAIKNGLCVAFKVFNLGANGTVYVGCGLPADHESAIDGAPGEPIKFHQAQQGEADGDLVIFRWPV